VLPPTPASITPYTISVSSDKYGQATISDVMFGDVWICSGQSNMKFAVSQVVYRVKYFSQRINREPSFYIEAVDLGNTWVLV